MIVSVLGHTRHGTVAATEYDAPDDLSASGVETWLGLNATDYYKIFDYRASTHETLKEWSQPSTGERVDLIVAATLVGALGAD